MASNFQTILKEAVTFFTERGYVSESDLSYWLTRIRKAAQDAFIPAPQLRDTISKAFNAIYSRLVDKNGILKYNSGISKYTITKLTPQMRTELDKRILAAVDLITINREETIAKTLKRFSGWATSIPVSGSEEVEKRKVKEVIYKPLKQSTFEERRVLIDQGHKLISNINDVVAEENDAIAAIWNSHWRQEGYNYRKDHKDRDEKVYLVRGNWAQEKGLVKPGIVGYTDQITKPGEEVFCRCFYTYLYNLRDIPDDMVTEKGKSEMTRIKELLEA